MNGILIIDDDPDIANLIADVLEDDYEVHKAVTTDEGYEILKRQEIAVLFCDENMPVENGLMFMARIRQEFEHLKMVLISGCVDQEVLAYAINETDVLRFLRKPFAIEEVKRNAREMARRYEESIDQAKQLKENKSLRQEVTSFSFLSRKFATRVREIARAIAMLAAVGLVVIASLFCLGIFVIFALYLLKTFCGIDIFQDVHFRDLL